MNHIVDAAAVREGSTFLSVIILFIQRSSPRCRSIWSKLFIICSCFRVLNFDQMICFIVVLRFIHLYYRIICFFNSEVRDFVITVPLFLLGNLWINNLRLRLYVKQSVIFDISAFVSHWRVRVSNIKMSKIRQVLMYILAVIDTYESSQLCKFQNANGTRIWGTLRQLIESCEVELLILDRF